MGSVSRQATLVKFGFIKKVETARRNFYKVHLEEFVAERKKQTDVTCPYCLDSKSFASQKYLNNHITYKHPGNKTIEIKSDKKLQKGLGEQTTDQQAEKGNCISNITQQKQNTETTQAIAAISIPQHNLKNSHETSVTERSRPRARVASSRQSYTLHFKLKVLQELDSASKDRNVKDKYKEVAQKNKISKSMVWKWKKQEHNL